MSCPETRSGFFSFFFAREGKWDAQTMHLLSFMNEARGPLLGGAGVNLEFLSWGGGEVVLFWKAWGEFISLGRKLPLHAPPPPPPD